MTDIPTLPVVHEITTQYLFEVMAETWLTEMEGRCEAFKATGAHRWETDAWPTFLCDRERPSQSWIGYTESCAAESRWVDRFGQHDSPCGVTRIPTDDCIVCGRYGEYLCDAPRCDVPLCDRDRFAAGRGLDFCPAHRPQGSRLAPS